MFSICKHRDKIFEYFHKFVIGYGNQTGNIFGSGDLDEDL